MEEQEKKPLKEELAEIREALAEIRPDAKKKKEKIKPFKLPAKSRLNKKKVQDNWVTVIVINENKNLKFIREKVIDQTIVVNGQPVLANSEYVLNYKGKPVVIVPSWSVKPFSPSANFNQSLKDGSNNAGYSLLLARMKAGALKGSRSLSGMAVLGGIIALAVVAYIFLGGGG